MYYNDCIVVFTEYRDLFLCLVYRMLYRKHVSEPWFSLIASGAKTCEGRLWKGDFRTMGVGDVLEFYCEDRVCRARIVGISVYDSFGGYLLGEGLDRCLPGIGSLKEGVAVYRQYYSERDESASGVVGIRLERLAV
jgi:ASC-1-like (ASCH) protein